jgi:hypothetical protein
MGTIVQQVGMILLRWGFAHSLKTVDHRLAASYWRQERAQSCRAMESQTYGDEPKGKCCVIPMLALRSSQHEVEIATSSYHAL